MADTIIRLKVESTEYENRLKRAVQGMQQLEKHVRDMGASFEVAEKADLEFVRALGDMETQTQSVKGQMREFTEAILTLKQQYDRLTDEEKFGEWGQAMMGSIDKLKVRAANLKDEMGDLDEELKNMASDTAFTDGVGMMTRTIGACSAAITVWASDSKEMEQVIKDLAKIGATVAAVEELTKVFQKQNLVLLKNPYVAAATAAAGLAVAIGKLIKESTELSAVEQSLYDVQKKGREDSAKEVTRIETLNTILRDNTRSLDERRTALAQIQSLVPEYHGALTDEGDLINDNTSALGDYISGLQRAATAQAAFDKMVELQKQKMEASNKLLEKQNELRAAQAKRETTQGSVVYAGSEFSNVYEQSNVNGAERAVQQAEANLRDINNQIKALNNLVSASDLSTSKGGIEITGIITTDEEVVPTGLIAGVEKRISELNKALRAAGDQKTIDEIQQQLAVAKTMLYDLLNNPFKTRNSQVIPLSVELLDTSTEQLTEEVNALRKKLGMEPIEIGITTNGKGGSTVDTAKQTEQAWSAAADAVQSIGGALQQIEDPSAKVAGIVMQAVANIALGFAQAAASPATGAAGVFGWIAAATAGLATMTATIASIKSVTSGSYADGGIIPGNNYSGDMLTANVNAGELILNRAQQSSIASQLASSNPMGGMQLEALVSGESLRLVLANNASRRGGNRAQYAISKFG